MRVTEAPAQSGTRRQRQITRHLTLATAANEQRRAEDFIFWAKMSSNCYEDPKRSMDVGYSKAAGEDRGDREERLVDIYESVDNFTCHHAVSSRDRGPHTRGHRPAVHRNPCRAAALILGLLCLLLLMGVAVLSVLYTSVILTSNQPETAKSGNGGGRDYCQQEKDRQKHGNATRWLRFKCSCYYVSTETGTWLDGRTDCRSRGADLVIVDSRVENEFVMSLNKSGDSWIGLQSVSKGWKHEWQWVDGTQLQYTAWAVGVTFTPTSNFTAYINLQGQWRNTNDGSKHWICEKQLD